MGRSIGSGCVGSMRWGWTVRRSIISTPRHPIPSETPPTPRPPTHIQTRTLHPLPLAIRAYAAQHRGHGSLVPKLQRQDPPLQPRARPLDGVAQLPTAGLVVRVGPAHFGCCWLARLLYGMGSILIGNVSWGRSINRLSDRWVEMGVVELGSEDALHRPPAPSVSSAEPLLEGGGGPAVA